MAFISLDKLKTLKGNHDRTLLRHTSPITTSVNHFMDDALKVRLRRYGTKGMWYYSLIPKFAELMNDNKAHILVVRCHDTFVVLTFRDITLGQSFVRLLHLPTSLGYYKDLELEILEILCNNKLISQIVANDEETEIAEKHLGIERVKKPIYRDYYSLIDERWREINQGKYRKRKKINKADKCTDYQTYTTSECNPADMEKLYYAWEDYKKSLGEDVLYPNLIQSVLNASSEDVHGICIKYKGKIIAQTFLTNTLNGCYMFRIMGQTIAKVDPSYYEDIYDDALHIFKNKIGAHIYYYSTRTMKNYGAIATYAAGDISPGGGLAEYKERNNNRVIDYYKIVTGHREDDEENETSIESFFG